jgi:hypothetical protein
MKDTETELYGLAVWQLYKKATQGDLSSIKHVLEGHGWRLNSTSLEPQRLTPIEFARLQRKLDRAKP